MDAPFVIIFGLLLIVFAVYFFRNKQNLKLLTQADKDLMSGEIAVAIKNEMRKVWIVTALLPLAILLDTYFRVHFGILIWYGIAGVFGVLVVFRSRRIHQKLNFPSSFVQSEFLFSLSMAVLLSILILYSIWQVIK